MRYLPLTDADRAAMLSAIGVSSMDDLYCDVPAAALDDAAFDLPDHAGEMEVERALAAMAAKNLDCGAVPSFLGAGAYRHHVPAAVDYIIQRGEFLTAYTPYQPEMSQGTLQWLFEFQTQVAMITGMEIASASHYDGATAAAEAALMARRLVGRPRVVVSGGLHPHYRAVIETYFRFLDGRLMALEPAPVGNEDIAAAIDGETACVVVQNPDFFGRLHDLTALAAAVEDAGALLVVVVNEVVSLGLVTSPGEMGAHLVAAEGQSLGNPLGFGGPHLGLFATSEQYVRQMPGRIAGETVDVDGRRGWVLTLATREQHIRREKATSNICTNAGLCALAFSAHLALLGEAGFRRLARINHANAVSLADRLAAVPGVEVLNESFFNEFTVRLPGDAASLVDTLAADGILAGVPVSRLWPGRPELADLLLVAATETTDDGHMDALAAALAKVL
jgi:glycine dehydrogenase subunit 1